MNEPSRSSSFGIGHFLFIAILFLAGAGLLGWAAARSFGWLPTPAPLGPDIARQAKDYLRERKVQPLSAPLEKLLDEAADKHQPSEKHPLVGQVAPDFDHVDVDDKHVRLSELVDGGPVVVVF